MQYCSYAEVACIIKNKKNVWAYEIITILAFPHTTWNLKIPSYSAWRRKALQQLRIKLSNKLTIFMSNHWCQLSSYIFPWSFGIPHYHICWCLSSLLPQFKRKWWKSWYSFYWICRKKDEELFRLAGEKLLFSIPSQTPKDSSTLLRALCYLHLANDYL